MEKLTNSHQTGSIWVSKETLPSGPRPTEQPCSFNGVDARSKLKGGYGHRNSRTRTLAASRDIADLWRSKMVPTKRQNNGGIADQLTRTNYWLDRARYLSIKFGSTTWQME